MATTLEDIKKLVIIALASDDGLMEALVLKGGNAIDLMEKQHNRGLSRASYDLDFSIAGDFEESIEAIGQRINKTLTSTFAEKDLVIFDFRYKEKPPGISEDMKHFWGGYNAEFKVISRAFYDSVGGDIEKLRTKGGAIPIMKGGSPKFQIEISKFEYVEGKVPMDIDGYQFFIYSPEMIVFEKLRAICQQLPDYKLIAKHDPRPRARDFYDIEMIMTQYHIDASTANSQQLIQLIFEAKKVPLSFIQQIDQQLDIHRSDWQNVLDTLSAHEQVQPFDYYADFVVQQFKPLTFL